MNLGFHEMYVERRLALQRRRAAPRVQPRFLNALPCPEFYHLHPEKVGVVGNVVLDDGEELRTLLLVARPVSAKYAQQHGGCIRVDARGDGKPQYYCITDSDDEVYGRASYLPRAPLLNKEELCASSCSCAPSSSLCGCSCDHATDRGSTAWGTEMSLSCRCV